MIGAKGLRGKSWPDLDMLPLGWLTSEGKWSKYIMPLSVKIDRDKLILGSPVVTCWWLELLKSSTAYLFLKPTMFRPCTYC